ncbi:hypothetical protein [Thermicanus aegyptius]|uniref:hypothetical protein n=1 Tax=Thermicanus aegyptius TaxID=94009 RepID=UPI0012EB18A0|nr:hypothetical protein [Thermicanus aegyptius]
MDGVRKRRQRRQAVRRCNMAEMLPNDLIKIERGFTLTEVILWLFLYSLLLTSLLPLFPLLREREEKLQREIAMEEEAIRFYTYMENRNADVLTWRIYRPNSVTISTYDQLDGRVFYQDGLRIAETKKNASYGGYLILAFMVKEIRYLDEGDLLRMVLTVERDGMTRTYEGVLPRYIEEGTTN